MAVKAETAIKYIDEKRDVITSVSDQIWALAEVGLHEDESAAVLAKALEAEGFQVTLGVADMPSALVATWGSGGPIVQFAQGELGLAASDIEPSRQEELVPRRGGSRMWPQPPWRRRVRGGHRLKARNDGKEACGDHQVFRLPCGGKLRQPSFPCTAASRRLRRLFDFSIRAP